MKDKKELGFLYFDRYRNTWIVTSYKIFEKLLVVGDLIDYGTRWAYPAVYGVTKSGFPKLYDYIDASLAKKLVDGGFTLYHKEYDYEDEKFYGVREV